ncbi:MAG: hypothetical protein R3F59_26545 [Myxococcota bacterium]
MLLVALSLGAAWAADPIGDAEDIDIPVKSGDGGGGDDWGFGKSDELKLTVDDDDLMKDFVAEKKKQAPPPVFFHLTGTASAARCATTSTSRSTATSRRAAASRLAPLDQRGTARCRPPGTAPLPSGQGSRAARRSGRRARSPTPCSRRCRRSRP